MSKKYLEFIPLGNPGRKTKIFMIRNSNGITRLGTIKWYSQWRRYAFYPERETLFDASCLQEIVEFIEKLMEERKA